MVKLDRPQGQEIPDGDAKFLILKAESSELDHAASPSIHCPYFEP